MVGAFKCAVCFLLMPSVSIMIPFSLYELQEACLSVQSITPSNWTINKNCMSPTSAAEFTKLVTHSKMSCFYMPRLNLTKSVFFRDGKSFSTEQINWFGAVTHWSCACSKLHRIKQCLKYLYLLLHDTLIEYRNCKRNTFYEDNFQDG